MLVERLGEVIVGAGFHAFDQILAQAFRGQQENVGVRFLVLRVFADAAAYFRAGKAGHDPIENRELGSFFALQMIPGFGAVAGHDHFIAPLAQGGVQEMPGDNAVVGN